MQYEILSALVIFSFVASITPGPNNLMLMTSGLNFGFRRSIPHLLGVALGFTFMILVVGAGLGAVFFEFPVLLIVLRYVGAAYMLWLAWKIASSGPLDEVRAGAKPLSFLGAAAFQWVNPKAWVMAVSGLTAYAVSSSYLATVLIVAGAYAFVGLPCVAVWVAFGASMRRFLNNPLFLRRFNIAMALLLAASVAPVLLEG